jgi:lipopolysaccharide export system protein LptC
MAVADNFYSQFVAWMRVILPLLAIGLLSTLFLFARAPDGGGEVPYSDVEVAELARDQRVTQPYYAGVAEDGATISISASQAKQDSNNSDTLNAQELSAEIVSTDGAMIQITATTGVINNVSQTARLESLTRIVISTGYQMETAGLIADLSTGRIETLGRVEAHSPMGLLTAGRLIVEPASESANSQVVFKDGVQVVYQPQP